MPALFLRFLPHILAAIAVIGAVFWIDRQGYERAQADQAALEARFAERLGKAVEDIDHRTGERIASIDDRQRTIVQPIITREIASDPRFSDPAAGISVGMLRGLNEARAASGPAGANQRAVPAVAIPE